MEMKQVILSSFSKAKTTTVMVKDKTIAIWKSGVKGKIILCAATFLVLWIVWPSGTTPPVIPPVIPTVDDVRREIVTTLNTELSSPSCPARKRIEDAHGTVTVYRAYVLKCDITTIDGSNKAGADRANISFVTVTIRFNWDGIIHQGGTTDLEVDLTADGKKCVRSRIVRTDAMVNMEDPDFWYAVGAGIGALLL